MDSLGIKLASLAAADKLQPKLENVFRAFTLCKPQDLRVIILGQDPYPNGADGLAFSNAVMKPSLRVIFKELDRSGMRRTKTTLEDWAEQGVLLLNTCLTTETGKTFAHKDWGWEYFTEHVLRDIINKCPYPLVFMAWGTAAKGLIRKYITPKSTRLILESCHPQAENYGGNNKFTGNNHFAACNEFLTVAGGNPIHWGDPS